MSQVYRPEPLTPTDTPDVVTHEAVAAWCAYWALFAALDMYVHRRRRTTLSKAGRHLFRVDTKTGKAVFTALYYAGAYALWRHVTRGGRR